MTEPDPRRYRFDPPDDGAVLFGLSPGPLLAVLAGLTGSVIGFSTGIAPLAALLPAVLGATVGFGRVRHRTMWEWATLTVAWHRTRLRARHWLARLPSPGRATPTMPACLAGLELHTIPGRFGRDFGAIHDRARGTVTVVVVATGPSFATEPAAVQDQHLHRWGAMLAAFAAPGLPVVHLGWSDRTGPGGLDAHTTWLRHQPSATAGTDQAVADYHQVLDQARPRAAAHTVHLFLTIHTHPESSRPSGSPNTDDVAPLLETLRTAAHNAQCTVSEPLTVHQLSCLVRAGADPFTTPIPGTNEPAPAPEAPGPLATHTHWDCVHTDGAWHRTYWMHTGPALPQPADWLEPLLATPALTRTITVYFQTVPVHRSRRRIERDLVRLDSDATTNTQRGRRTDARHHRATQAVLDREAELVAGYPELTYLVLVTVTAPTRTQLDHDAARIEHVARDAGIDLRVLHARQDLAWAAALPLGLAPRHLQ